MIEIFGLKRVQNPRPNRSGDTILAFFDAQVEWLTIEGAALVQLGSGAGITVWEPLAKADQRPRRCMRMDGPVRQKVAEAALPFFQSLGGRLD
ncbi:hypothetical protein [Tranquillimonas alkanivorans]|uniref:Uncharacterized protein n=1 Tax=Tranquillimonas alkanivorans TaxID=441119 RepID=A0A1I5PM33_9RHOB|nr:hypothetical protein [Tranquillimonas alkanivorans]SFP35095.1 hypothetical protein SAMN04488047_105166 [Tranquillimonas alkanivorans]